MRNLTTVCQLYQHGFIAAHRDRLGLLVSSVQQLDDFNRIRPKLPIGPRGELGHLFPTYIGFERSHHEVPDQA